MAEYRSGGRFITVRHHRIYAGGAFLLYLALTVIFYPMVGRPALIANALPVLTVAFFFGMWRAAALFGVCYLFVDIILLFVLSGEPLREVIGMQFSGEALLGAFTGLVVTLLIGRMSDMNREIQGLHDEVLALSRRDFLTGLYNRGTLMELLYQEFNKARRQYFEQRKSAEDAGEPLFSVALLDIDYFKEVNDAHGHLVGDAVLRTIGAIFASADAFRASDIKGRYGGEEFLVVLPQTSAEQALFVIKKLQDRVKAHDFTTADNEVFHISMSCGIADYKGQHDSAEELLKQADEALYRSKRLGRDRAEIY